MSEKHILQREGTLVISCDVIEPENVILKILGTESLPNVIECNGIKGYPWSFETKYYTAVINLYPFKEKVELDSSFCDTIKGIIFYFDSQKHSSFKDVLRWMPCLKSIQAEVQLLVCNNFTDESESSALEKKNILDWCVKHEYELVELNPPHDSDDEDECAFKDAKGYGRIVQALQSHPWSDLKMKSEKKNENSRTKNAAKSTQNAEDKKSVTNSQAACGSISDEKKLKKDKDKSKAPSGALQDEEEWLNNLANEEPGEESFETMFAKFASMKDKAERLTGEERKKFAEKVAITFWRAMGGDEDEIAELEDLDDEN